MRSVFENIVKVEIAPTGVIEDAIQHDLHAALVEFVAQCIKGFVPTQQRINLIIVMGMVAVIAGTLEDGREVDRVYAEFLQVIEMFDHTVQVTAFVTLTCWQAVPRFEIMRLEYLIRFGETVRKNLVEDGVFD